MKKSKPTLLLLFCSLALFYSCGTSHFQQRKNFHLRVKTDPVIQLASSTPVMIKHPKKTPDPNRETVQDLSNSPHEHSFNPTPGFQKSHSPVAGAYQVTSKFQQNKILKINDVKKTNDEGTGLAAIILGALAILFLVFGFVLLHVSISLFVAFWLAGLKLGIYGAIAGIIAVADDDDTIEVIGCILGCFAVLLAFILLCIVLL
jgi:hypothetical protein